METLNIYDKKGIELTPASYRVGEVILTPEQITDIIFDYLANHAEEEETEETTERTETQEEK